MNMKKIILALLIATFTLALVACSEQVVENTDVPEEIIGTEDMITIQDDLNAIMETILVDVNVPESEIVEVPADAVEYYFGIEAIEGAEAIASEAIGGAEPHSICLMRVPEGTDVEEVADSIQVNADPNKWIYEEAETVLVETNGNVILLAMTTSEIANAVVENFDTIPEEEL